MVKGFSDAQFIEELALQWTLDGQGTLQKLQSIGLPLRYMQRLVDEAAFTKLGLGKNAIASNSFFQSADVIASVSAWQPANLESG